MTYAWWVITLYLEESIMPSSIAVWQSELYWHCTEIIVNVITVWLYFFSVSIFSCQSKLCEKNHSKTGLVTDTHIFLSFNCRIRFKINLYNKWYAVQNTIFSFIGCASQCPSLVTALVVISLFRKFVELLADCLTYSEDRLLTWV